MRSDVKVIFDSNFNADEQTRIMEFGEILKSGKSYKNKIMQREIWKFDQELRGLGGYTCPLNPTMNPFNQMREYRNVFRSLQYGRCDMFHLMRGRHIICDVGLHIETLIKIMVSKHSVIPFLKNNRMLGKNVNELKDKKIISYELYIKITQLIKIYNIAKHDTDEENNITFSIIDGLIFYFACRKIGNELLKYSGHFSYGKKYRINEFTEWEELDAVDENGRYISYGLDKMLDLTEIM